MSSPANLEGKVFKSLLQVGCFLDLVGLSLHCSFCAFQLAKTEHLFASLNFMYELLFHCYHCWLLKSTRNTIIKYVFYTLINPHWSDKQSIRFVCNPKCVFPSNAGLSNVLISSYF